MIVMIREWTIDGAQRSRPQVLTRTVPKKLASRLDHFQSARPLKAQDEPIADVEALTTVFPLRDCESQRADSRGNAKLIEWTRSSMSVGFAIVPRDLSRTFSKLEEYRM